MLCEYCERKIEKKNRCKKIVGLLNRCPNFVWSNIFWCKRLGTWAGLIFCQYKVVNKMDGCTENCPQRIELMATGHKYLDPFPYLPRIQKQYCRNLGGWWSEMKKTKKLLRRRNGR